VVTLARSSGGGAAEFERRQRQYEREVERARKAADAAQKAADREARQRYLATRAAEADQRTHELDERVEQLRTVLTRGLSRSARVGPAQLHRRATPPPLNLGSLAYPVPAPDWAQFAPPPPSTLGRVFGGGTRYEQKLNEARSAFDAAQAQHAQAETERQRRVTEARSRHAARAAELQREVDDHNRAIDAVLARARARDQEAVEWCLNTVLAAVPLPSDFPRTAEVTYSPRGEQAVLQFELPGPAVVPATRAVQYVQTKDEQRELPRPAKETGELYRLVVSQVALLCLRDVFQADPAIQAIAFNGHVWATNPATGKREYPCLISLSVDRPTFEELVLTDVRPDVCLKHLRALVSPHPYDLEPIKPIVDFDLSKYRFVEGLDAVSTLDSRPDLMDLSPDEFEHLVRQVFEATGLEGWTTEHSRDDGVDAVMVNKTPGRGMHTIIQAKRYSKVVGVAHIRELAGAMEEKKAGHGILVTTSGFTAGCWQKARDHGRMELFDGARLLAMIREHLGKDVLIGIDRPPNAPDRADRGDPTANPAEVGLPQPEPGARRRQAALAGLVVGEGSFDDGPEGWRVVGLGDVGQFVDEDVVDEADG
jgi:restriction system protein